MKLLFSEYKSDYDNYIFPYVIWAMPEAGEKPTGLFSQGFLPSSGKLERFYMCRQVRVELSKFEPSSENRRILRKGNDITFKVIPREQFQYTKEWQQFCKRYADHKFGSDVMSEERLKDVFNSPACSHLLTFYDENRAQDVGLVVMYLSKPEVAFYYYSFYELDHDVKSLGMVMMTLSVQWCRNNGYRYIYLGSCYSRNALYKTQFTGFEFWNGTEWSKNLGELKYMIKRDSGSVSSHLLEDQEYIEMFLSNRPVFRQSQSFIQSTSPFFVF